MKKPLFLFSIAIVLFLFACGNQSSQGTTGSNRDPNAADLIIGANYYLETKDDQGNVSLKYGGWLPEGSTVVLLPGEVKKASVPDAKGNLYDDQVSPARLPDGKNVLVSRYYILPGQRAGVIIAADKAMVYNGLKPANATTSTLPRLTLVGVAPLDEKDNPLKRQQFTAYKAPQAGGAPLSSGIWGPLYLDSADVSTSASDVEVAKTITVDLPKADKSVWGKIVDDTVKLYPDSALLEDLKAMIGQGPSPAAGPKTTEAVTLSATVKDDNVNVRSSPDENAGNVVGQLAKDEAVNITAQTVDSYTVSGDTARWYKVKTDTLEGWVFGAYLSVQ